jgi:hypothetical protein
MRVATRSVANPLSRQEDGERNDNNDDRKRHMVPPLRGGPGTQKRVRERARFSNPDHQRLSGGESPAPAQSRAGPERETATGKPR